MNMLETLKDRLAKTTKDFHKLNDENKYLKEKIEQLERKNTVLTRKTQDLILTINTRLKKGNTP